MSKPRLVLVGQMFGRLAVIAFDHVGHGTMWRCTCDCGASTVVSGSKLKRGATKSCGCLMREARKALRPVTKHGHSPIGVVSLTYHSWDAMIQRCTNPRSSAWPRYGGRGIAVCDRWRNSFQCFLADVGERPTGTTLDRFPNGKGNYEPGNVRWANAREQRRNSSRATIGFDKALAICVDILGGEYPTAIARRHGVKVFVVRGIRDEGSWPDAMERARCIATHDGGDS